MLVLWLTGSIDTIGQLLRDMLLSIPEGVITMRPRTNMGAAPWPRGRDSHHDGKRRADVMGGL
jgi:hypothetical protein